MPLITLLKVTNCKFLLIKHCNSVVKNYSLFGVLYANIKISGESREQPNQNKEMKTANLFLLSLFMRDNEKCNISHAT